MLNAQWGVSEAYSWGYIGREMSSSELVFAANTNSARGEKRKGSVNHFNIHGFVTLLYSHGALWLITK